jgi:CheY-like chemotaxis protein
MISELKKALPMDIHHICMADDDADDYYLFSTILKQVDDSVQVTWFKTGIELLDNLILNNVLPDLILLDMNMPANDGLESLQKIKQHFRLKNIPVVILSTAGSPGNTKKAYELGAVKYLIKPFSIEELKQVIKEILAIPIPVNESNNKQK